MDQQAFDQQSDATNEHNQPALDEQMAQGLNVDEDIAGSQLLNEQMADEQEVSRLRDELEASKDKYIRLVAEFDNFRRRTARERVELIQTASKDVVSALLEVVDDMDRASEQMEKTEDIALIREGNKLVFNKLKHILQQQGLKAMECMHQEFDPELHEAIAEIPAPAPELAGKVVDVVQQGYYLNDKLIRYAKVVVGK